MFILSSNFDHLLYIITLNPAKRFTGFHVLPTDILGTRFMTVPHTDHTVIFMTQGYDTEVLSSDIEIPKYSLHKEQGFAGLASLTKPAAVFSVQTDEYFMKQIPPIEALNRIHYIPAFDWNSIGATSVQVIVTSTEDSTYIVIKGAYDQVRLIRESRKFSSRGGGRGS